MTLLRKLRTDDLLPPKMPLPVWKAIHALVPIPAAEVIVTRTGKDFLLVNRKDEDWDGWHIPGGYLHHKESIPDACKRIAKTELALDVSFKQCIDTFMWPDHPYSSALSLVCVCTATGTPSAGEFFMEIPEKMIPHHREFLETFLQGKSQS